MSKRTPTDNRRYKLHQKIKHDFKYSANTKTVFIPYDYQMDIDPFLLELRDKYKYNLQYTIK
jgi:hypothetical protein